MNRRILSIIFLAAALVVGSSVFAQTGTPDGEVVDTLSLAGQFKDISFTAFLIGCCFMLWRKSEKSEDRLVDVLQRQADWNRAVTPPILAQGMTKTPEPFKGPLASFSRGDEKPS